MSLPTLNRLLQVITLCSLILACSDQDPSTHTTQNSDEHNISSQDAGSNNNAEPDLAKMKRDFASTPFNILHIAELDYDSSPAITILLSAPIDPNSQWRNYLTIQTDKGDTPDGEWILNKQLNAVHFPFIETNSHYKIRVKEGLASLSGFQLSQEKIQSIQTGKAKKNIRFVSRGTQLSPSLSDGLSIESVNVAAIDIDFHRVNDTGIARFLQQNLRSNANNYYDLEVVGQYSTLSYSARFDLNNTENKTQKTLIPLDALDEIKVPGIYYAVMKPAGDHPYEYKTTWFTVGDIGVQVRTLKDELLAFVHYSDSAKAAANTTIQLYDHDAKILDEQKSDNQGFARFRNISKKAHYAIAQNGDHYAVLKLKNATMDLSDYRLVSREQRALELFLYAPRDLYRPGEQVQINALLRDFDGKLSPSHSISVSIKTPDDSTFSSFTWKGDAQAFYEHSFKLPQQASTGQWRLVAKLGNGDAFTYPFNVEEFLPERMKMQLVNPHGKHQGNQKSIEISIQGDYLYGAPASGNRVEFTVRTQQARTLFDNWKEFIFGQESYREFDDSFSLETHKLDDTGHLDISVAPRWQTATQPIRVNTEVSLFESGGRPVSRSIEQVIWPRNTLVGIRPLWQGNYANPRSHVDFELINIDQNAKLQNSSDLSVLLIREDHQYYWRLTDAWQYSNSQRDVPVYNRVLRLNDKHASPLSVPVEYGNYRLEIRDKDQLVASYRFYSGWSWDHPDAGETGRPDKVALSWPTDSIQAGEQATLTIDAPYDGTALVTIEGHDLLWKTQTTVTGGINHIDIPVAASWNTHNLYATVSIIRAGVAKRKQLPKRAFGLIHLPLNRQDRQLQLSVEHADKVKPDTRFHAKLTLPKNQAKNAHATVALVDSGVLSISQFKTPQASSWFFAPRAYQGEIRDTWASFIEELTDRRARQRFGGDAEELSRGGDLAQSQVQIVSLWSGKISFDEKGEAELDIQLPYFNGELRLMAMVWNDQQFASHEAKITVAAPMIAEVSTPRFMARGDQSTASFDLQNLTADVQIIDIKAQASPALGGEVIVKTLHLEPQQREFIKLPLLAIKNSGLAHVDINVSANADNTSSDPVALARSWDLALRPPYPAELRHVDTVLDTHKQLEVPREFLTAFEHDKSQFNVSISPTPPLNLNEHLVSLLQYPYGCLEQTTSRAWPLMSSSESDLVRYYNGSNSSNGNDIRLQTGRVDAIQSAISHITGMHRGDGSFGLWSNQSAENHWLTVYASEFLLAAKDRGYQLDDAVLKATLKRLKEYLTTRGRLWNENNHYSQWPDHYHFSYRSYAALVLARKQQARLSDVRNLYDNFNDFSKRKLPFAQIALALELAGDPRRAKEAWGKALAKTTQAKGYTGDYSTRVRDLAWTMSLALESKLIDNPFASLIELRDALVESRWLSTQDRWALYRLGTSLEKNRSPSWKLNVLTDAKALEASLQNSYQNVYRDADIPQSYRIDNTNESPLYISLRHLGYPDKSPAMKSEGIRIKRTYYDDKGQLLDLKKLYSGDLVLVRLEAISQNEKNIPDALLVDLLPSGLELENQNLASAINMLPLIVEGKSVEQWQSSNTILNREFRDDRFVAAVKLNSRRATNVFYLARAVTPGRYIVPPSLAEDMYRPWIHAIGNAQEPIVIVEK